MESIAQTDMSLLWRLGGPVKPRADASLNFRGGDARPGIAEHKVTWKIGRELLRSVVEDEIAGYGGVQVQEPQDGLCSEAAWCGANEPGTQGVEQRLQFLRRVVVSLG